MNSSTVFLVLFLGLVAVNAKPSADLKNSTVKISAQHFHKKFNSSMKYQDPDNFPWDTFCVDYNVPDGTFFPHPEDCNWYFLCWEGELQPGACEEREHFNPELGICDLEENYECVLGLYPEWDSGNDCPPPGSNDLVLLPSNFCDSFYICINGFPIEMQCRPGHHWNAEMEYCDDPRNAGCDGDTNFPQLLPDCPVSFTGNVPHPDNCEYYIHCANGNRFIQRCPHLFNFDIVSERCAVITQATCIDEYRGRRRN